VLGLRPHSRSDTGWVLPDERRRIAESLEALLPELTQRPYVGPPRQTAHTVLLLLGLAAPLRERTLIAALETLYQHIEDALRDTARDVAGRAATKIIRRADSVARERQRLRRIVSETPPPRD
jgi:hypothetical protein